MLKRLLVPMMVGLAVVPLQAGAWAHVSRGGFVHGPAGNTAAWHRSGTVGGGWGYHGGVYHGDTVYHGGCWGCASAGAVAAAGVVGLAAGAAIGSAAASTPSTVVVQQPVYVTSPAIGSIVTTLPGGCTGATVNGVQYYRCDDSFYKPHFGSSGVTYTVVQNPF